MKMANHRNLAIAILALAAVSAIVLRQLEDKTETVQHPNATHPAEQAILPANGQTPPFESGAKAGLLAPSFTIQGENGVSYSVGGARDKAVLLNFWASWCDPCQAEAPELNQIAEKYKDTLDIYGINVTSYDYKANAERFVKKHKLVFPVMFDLKGEVYAKYNGSVFPTNVLIDRRGVISEIILGGLTAEQLDGKLEKLMQQKRL
ncbi:thiol-disulfide isomerase/thioredoxin [Paenibacillus forsythiae]|uniref:Thiol-disulfide isomerase/thioredoxin n=1 Tax=Paenibacillus forsythiae TaxID=365616 RepID=A0ABU3H7W2_9BACL|nr:TlpA disulfide reductase family protein [Paenibacillus forsythiae]MDT3426914.1 thiol-disulfide isomerase/thioredoxin [Paenibacillus forsythiae]